MVNDNNDDNIKSELADAEEKLDAMENKLKELEKSQNEDSQAAEQVLEEIASETGEALDQIAKDGQQIGQASADDEKLEKLRNDLQ